MRGIEVDPGIDQRRNDQGGQGDIHTGRGHAHTQDDGCDHGEDQQNGHTSASQIRDDAGEADVQT